MNQINETINKASSKIVLGRAFKNLTRIQREQALLVLTHLPRQLIQRLFIGGKDWKPMLGEFDEKKLGEISNEEFIYIAMGLIIYLFENLSENQELGLSFLKISKNHLFKIVETSFGSDNLILINYNKFNQAFSGQQQKLSDWPISFTNALLNSLSHSDITLSTSLSNQISNSFHARKLKTYGDEFLREFLKKLKQTQSSRQKRIFKFAAVMTLFIIVSYNLILNYGHSSINDKNDSLTSKANKKDSPPEKRGLANKNEHVVITPKTVEPNDQAQSIVVNENTEESSEGFGNKLLSEPEKDTIEDSATSLLNELKAMVQDEQPRSNLLDETTESSKVDESIPEDLVESLDLVDEIKKRDQHIVNSRSDGPIVSPKLNERLNLKPDPNEEVSPPSLFGLKPEHFKSKEVTEEENISTSGDNVGGEKEFPETEIQDPRMRIITAEGLLKGFERKETFKDKNLSPPEDSLNDEKKFPETETLDLRTKTFTAEGVDEELALKKPLNLLPETKASPKEGPNLNVDKENTLDLVAKFPIENSIESSIENALQSIDSGNYESAIVTLKNILAENPDHVEGNFYIGLSYVNTKQLKLAKPYFYDVIRNNLSSSSIKSKSYTELAKIFLEDNRPQISRFALDDAISADPSNREAQALKNSIIAGKTNEDGFMLDLN